MKNLKKVILIISISFFIVSCSSNDANTLGCETCSYTIAANETAGTVATSLNGTHETTFSSFNTASPVADGTKATFTIANNELTVEIEGEACITLKNPIQTSASEVVYKDDCRDNLAYAVSTNQTGDLNEVNLLSLSNAFYGQFKK